jgi:hypothetical protein
MTMPCPALVCLNGWAGYRRHRITILAEHKRSYRVRWDDVPCNRPHNRGRFVPGQTYLVPKTAVVIGDPAAT